VHRGPPTDLNHFAVLSGHFHRFNIRYHYRIERFSRRPEDEYTLGPQLPDRFAAQRAQVSDKTKDVFLRRQHCPENAAKVS
jgi:hypothetical protein